MGKRKDIKKILVIGAGPIVIGQACEFDYSGTQACKALKDEGYKVILLVLSHFFKLKKSIKSTLFEAQYIVLTFT